MSDFGSRVECQIPRLRRYAYALVRNRDMADDLVQETLIRALSKRHLWQPGTDLRAWLFTLMHNQYVNYVRRGIRETVLIATEAGVSMSHPATQTDVLRMRDLRNALARLPDDQRTVVLLIGIEGISYEEVADVLAVPVGTIRSRLSRARDALRELMGETSRPSGRHFAAARSSGVKGERTSLGSEIGRTALQAIGP